MLGIFYISSVLKLYKDSVSLLYKGKGYVYENRNYLVWCIRRKIER